MAGVEVTATGPLFNGTAEKLIADFCEEAQTAIGDHGYDLFKGNLDDSIKHNGGVYTGFIRVTDEPRGRVVDDGWSVTNELPYGLWLEGVGRRNAPVTRFEGYHSLEKAAAQLAQDADGIAQEILTSYIAEMNG
jgi:hypothetical protein